MISSPWIWGRIVDLGNTFLPAKRQEWMETVVQRAGSSHLWINGDVLKPDSITVGGRFNTRDFFIRLLDGDLATWERVEMLSVTIYGQEIPDVIQRCFLSRAPALKTFEVLLPDMPGDQYLLGDIHEPGGGTSIALVQGQGRTSLFADHAPSLRIISAHQVIPILHYSHSPWLSHIRKMTIPPCVRMDDIYATLARTPILECLSLDLQPTLTASWGATGLQPLMPRYQANLRCLTDVRIKTNFLGCTEILEYLSPSRITGLSVFRLEICTSYPSVYFPGEIRQLYQHLPLYISHYFRTDDSRSELGTVPEKVFLGFEQREFQFMDITGSSDYNPAFVDFLIDTYHNFAWEEDEEDSIKICILDSIVQAAQAVLPGGHPTTFGSIKELVLGFMDARPTVHQHLYAAVSVFNFVQSIRIGEHCMDVIWEITSQHLAQGNPWHSVNASGDSESTHEVQLVLFPEMRVFHLTSIDDGKYTGLRGLLKKRKELGCPMPKLDLRETRPGGPGSKTVRHDFSIFEEVDGLEVVWKRLKDDSSESWSEPSGESGPVHEACSYICGSGDPDQLKELPLHPKLPF